MEFDWFVAEESVDIFDVCTVGTTLGSSNNKSSDFKFILLMCDGDCAFCKGYFGCGLMMLG